MNPLPIIRSRVMRASDREIRRPLWNEVTIAMSPGAVLWSVTRNIQDEIGRWARGWPT